MKPTQCGGLLFSAVLTLSSIASADLEWISVSSDGKSFVFQSSGKTFVPWGFNYDHDEQGRLLEDYWDYEWAKVEEDFREMKELGANVVRVHLQVGQFLTSADETNKESLRQLRRLLRLAEQTGLYLDVTGLGCYHKADVPEWYDALSEEQRWNAQARFWRAVARECKDSPAVFAYDLMNEPVAPTPDGTRTNWLGPPFAGKYFVQWISLEGKGRGRTNIAKAWIQKLSAAIRAEDKRHLITVGLVDWSLDRPGLSLGFAPQAIAADVDFLSVHIYPEKGKIDEAIDVLKQFSVGKPVVIEETFPLRCSVEELASFFDRSKGIASGWIGFYWGKTPAECRASKTVGDALTLGWLEFFQAHSPKNAQSASLRSDALTALRRGVEFFRREVAVEGTYLWQYGEDLSRREGEGKASNTRGWVQPPGTPSVGMAFIAAYDATGDKYFLEAARETAYGLIRGQLRSGGWTYSIDFAPAERKKIAYRDGGGRDGRNFTTLDDNTTQSALRFLATIDQRLDFRDAKIHEAVTFCIESLIAAQYPNGAWPQGYERAPDPEKFPVKPASYPETWPRTWPGANQYWLRYTINDNALATVVETLFDVARIQTNLATQCRAAAQKAGDFLILAQMPEPQPAWAQQYDFEMHPAWARKFEPPSVTGGESQGAIETLMLIYRETGEAKYLKPIPRALEYLKRSRLPDGKLARFYELRTNKPLYFTKDYQLTYEDNDVPTHYAFKVEDRIEELGRDFERVKALDRSKLKGESKPLVPKLTPRLEADVRKVISSQDSRGRWVEDGRLRHHGGNDDTRRVIRSATFIRNVETLSRYLAASK